MLYNGTEVQQRHRKQLSVMRGYLEGRQFFVAADALEVTRRLDEGFRKDGFTPLFHHQLSVARLITTLTPHLMYPEETITAAFLHDILEDHGERWTREDLTARFGTKIADAVWTLTKKYRGSIKDKKNYYDEIALSPIASIVKISDRAHNLQTMQGVFDSKKQQTYLQEVDELFFTTIRTARRNFPKQYGAYENLKILLRCQTRLIHQVLEAEIHGYSLAESLLDELLTASKNYEFHSDVPTKMKLSQLIEKISQHVEVRNLIRAEPHICIVPSGENGGQISE